MAWNTNDTSTRSYMMTNNPSVWQTLSEVARAAGETISTVSELIGEFIGYAWDGNPSDPAGPLLKKRLRWRQYQVNFIDHRQTRPRQIPDRQIAIRNHLFSRRMMPHNPRDKREKQQSCLS